MLNSVRWLMMAFALTASTAMGASGKTVTRELLMKGITIPERRAFPVSSSVSPCEDFHKYVCGDVESSFKLPADRSRWTFSFQDSSERLLKAKQNYFLLLEKGYQTTTERAAQFKDVYLACMKTDRQKIEEQAYVKKELAAVSALNTRDDFSKFYSDRLGKADYTLVDFGEIANQDDPTNRDFYMLVNLMSLPEKSYYQKEDLMKDFNSLVTLFFKTLKVKDAEKRAQAVIEFEKSFAELYPVPAEFRQRISANTYLPREEWNKKYPRFQLEGLLGKIPATAKIRDFTKESMEFVNRALDQTDLQTLKDVALFHALKDLMDQGYPVFYKRYFDFKKKYLGGPAARPPLQERCTTLVMNTFGMELDYELMPILFPHFPEDRAIAVGEKVRQAILAGLDANKWLSREARREAKKKIQVAALHLVKPKKDADWEFLPMQKYDPKSPIENMRKINQAKIDKVLKEMHEKRNRDQWGMSPLTVNAYYSPADNVFVLPQGILQFPFFDGGQTDIENAGAMGAVVGHELGHGIDDQGAKYDSTGKLRQWMTMNDLAEFSKRGGQFVERYDKLGHNGKLTLGENIGDHVGITFAFHAAFPDEKKASIEDMKKFFMSYGRLWCAVYRPEAAQLQLKTNPHSLWWARINGQVPHQEAFAKAFSCKEGDKMFLPPAERIRVW